jgi:hypothetical protein
MKVYLSHISVLNYWRTQQVAENPRPASSPLRFAPAAPCDDIEWPDLFDSPLIFGVPRPLHLLIRENQHHQYDQDVHYHRTTAEPPSRGFARLSCEVHVATPEYAFLQIAGSYPLSRLVAFGYELCGTYSLRPWEEGRPAHYSCVPLTNPERLRRFVQTHKSRRGGLAACRAAALVKGVSGSSMEPVLVLLLCLPVRMGGYGLPWPDMNKLVMVRDGSGRHVGWRLRPAALAASEARWNLRTELLAGIDKV